jgi:hypothetical protein
MLDRQDSHIVRQVILLDYSAQYVMGRTLQQLQSRIPIGSQSKSAITFFSSPKAFSAGGKDN